MDISYKTAAELRELLQSKQLSAVELTRTYLEKISRTDATIKAFVTVTEKEALDQAEQVDKKIKQGLELKPLEGIPMAYKDNICTEGVLTTCCSKMLETFVPPYSATVAERLQESGAIMLGKLNMDEFAMGSSTENSYFHPTRNPWNTDCVPGGSSGGSAAAVAADEVVFALGTDTGGSIRQPASFCGVVGLKPTYGAVSRYGVVAFASSLDQVGTLTQTVTDNAMVLNAIAGYDPRDSMSARFEKPDYTKYLVNDVKGLRIGLPKEYLGDGVSEDVQKVIRETVKTLTDLGAYVEECSMPHTEYVVPTYYLIATAEASSNLARFDGVRYGYRAEDAEDMIEMFIQSRAQGFGAEVKRRIMLGTYALSSGYYDAYYLKAQKVRTLIKGDFEQAFKEFDLILAPSTPGPAYKFGEKTDPLAIYLHDIYTIPANLAGLPAISIPAGFSNGLPIGIQFLAKPFGEGLLYRAAYTLEQNTEFHKVKPQLKEVL